MCGFLGRKNKNLKSKRVNLINTDVLLNLNPDPKPKLMYSDLDVFFLVNL